MIEGNISTRDTVSIFRSDTVSQKSEIYLHSRPFKSGWEITELNSYISNAKSPDRSKTTPCNSAGTICLTL